MPYVNVFAYGALTHYGDPFQKSSANTTHHIAETVAPTRSRPTTPTPQRPPAITRDRFSHIRFRSPLLTESHIVFSSCGY
jgi:hypothetical protein